MKNRHKSKENTNKSIKLTKDHKTLSTPKVVATHKTKRAKKRKENKVQRESIITNLEASYLDPIRGNKQSGIRAIKLSGYELAIINNRKLFKDIESKPDRMNNRAVDYMIPHLKLLNFLLENFSEHYRKKIWDNGQFRSLLETYHGTAEFSSVTLLPTEKADRLKSANQWLIDSLSVIHSNIPSAFKQSLNELGKPYFSLIKAICDNEGIRINIPDNLIR